MVGAAREGLPGVPFMCSQQHMSTSEEYFVDSVHERHI